MVIGDAQTFATLQSFAPKRHVRFYKRPAGREHFVPEGPARACQVWNANKATPGGRLAVALVLPVCRENPIVPAIIAVSPGRYPPRMVTILGILWCISNTKFAEIQVGGNILVLLNKTPRPQ